MIIFLAAMLDVPGHLHESAAARRRGRLQRFRFVTLPTISPVILFAVVIGVIQALQYFTQAYVAAASPPARPRRRAPRSRSSWAIPEGSTLFYPSSSTARASASSTWAMPSSMAMVLLVVAFAVTLVIIRNSRRWVHQAGALAMSATRPVRHPGRAPQAPAGGAPAAFPDLGGRAQPADRAAVFFLAPFLFIALTALMTHEQALSPDLWPKTFQWGNFAEVFSQSPLLEWTLNTMIYAALATLGVLLSSIPVAYASRKLRWRGRNASSCRARRADAAAAGLGRAAVRDVGEARPGSASLWPLIIPAWLGDAFSIFLLRQFFLTIPEEYLDAARVDGCSEFRILTTVVLRLAKPAIAAVAIFSILYAFNDFFLPLLYVGENPDNWVVSIGLSQFRSLHQVQWNLTMAATLLVMAPVIVLFFFAQKAFVEGVTLTGVKG